jgi:hypothetical protein
MNEDDAMAINVINAAKALARGYRGKPSPRMSFAAHAINKVLPHAAPES